MGDDRKVCGKIHSQTVAARRFHAFWSNVSLRRNIVDALTKAEVDDFPDYKPTNGFVSFRCHLYDQRNDRWCCTGIKVSPNMQCAMFMCHTTWIRGLSSDPCWNWPTIRMVNFTRLLNSSRRSSTAIQRLKWPPPWLVACCTSQVKTSVKFCFS